MLVIDCVWKATSSFRARLTTHRSKNQRRNWKLLWSTRGVSAKLWCQSSSLHIFGGRLARVSDILTAELCHNLDMLCSSMIRCQGYPGIWDWSPVLATRHAALLIIHRPEHQGVPGTGNRLMAIPGARRAAGVWGWQCLLLSEKEKAWMRGRSEVEGWRKRHGKRERSPNIKLFAALKLLQWGEVLYTHILTL